MMLPGDVSVHGLGDLYIWEGSIDAERYISRFGVTDVTFTSRYGSSVSQKSCDLSICVYSETSL